MVLVTKSNQAISNDATHVIVPYGMISRKNAPIVGTLIALQPDVAIIDESDNLNGHTSNRTKAVYGVANVGGIIASCEYVWPMTGTPIRRYNDDLHPMLQAVFPEVMALHSVRARESFVKQFCLSRKIRYAGMRFAQMQVFDNRNSDVLHGILYDEIGAIRRRLVDVAPDMPPMTVREVPLEFNPSKTLKAMLDEMALAKEGMIMDDYGNLTEESSPIMSQAMNLMATEKAPAVFEYLEGVHNQLVDADMKSAILVPFWHRDGAMKLKDMMEDEAYTVAIIDGKTSRNQREKIQDEFNAGRIDFLLGQIQAVGVAIDLQQECAYVVFAERHWSPGMNTQAMQRVWRMGQKTHVQVDMLTTGGLLDDIKVEITARKATGSQETVGL